jgi:hypothetical protein
MAHNLLMPAITHYRSEVEMKLVRNQKGQGVMEYVILTSLIGIFSLMAVKQFGTVIEKRIENMKEYVVKQVPLKRL